MVDPQQVRGQSRAEAERGGPHLTVIYNGLEREIDFRLQEPVNEVRLRAVLAFSITQNSDALLLFTEAGQEIPNGPTAHDAGIRPNQRLLLRPRAVSGGIMT